MVTVSVNVFVSFASPLVIVAIMITVILIVTGLTTMPVFETVSGLSEDQVIFDPAVPVVGRVMLFLTSLVDSPGVKVGLSAALSVATADVSSARV